MFVQNKINNSSDYMLESSSLWYDRLEHINNGFVHKITYSLFKLIRKHKCKTWVGTLNGIEIVNLLRETMANYEILNNSQYVYTIH